MSKIKKLWKVLARSISWNLKVPENKGEFMKSDKKEQQKNVCSEDIKGRIA